jgi:hypothetical protein
MIFSYRILFGELFLRLTHSERRIYTKIPSQARNFMKESKKKIKHLKKLLVKRPYRKANQEDILYT